MRRTLVPLSLSFSPDLFPSHLVVFHTRLLPLLTLFLSVVCLEQFSFLPNILKFSLVIILRRIIIKNVGCTKILFSLVIKILLTCICHHIRKVLQRIKKDICYNSKLNIHTFLCLLILLCHSRQACSVCTCCMHKPTKCIYEAESPAVHTCNTCVYCPEYSGR